MGPRSCRPKSGVKLYGTLTPSAAVKAAAAATGGGFGSADGDGVDAAAAALGRRAPFWASQHDGEIWAVALPALAAMLLEPGVNAQLSALSLGSLAVTLVTFFHTFLLFLTVPEIAEAVVTKGDEEVSRVAAKSLWIAVVCGVVSAAALFLGAETIVAMLKPPEAAVAAFATGYIKIRSLGVPAVLLGYVAVGVFRGFKDTRTPLLAAVLSAVASLGLNVMLLYVLRLGVVGSAIATTGAQLVSCGLLLGALLWGPGGRVQPRHLSRPPPLAAMVPTLKLGAVLGARNIVTFGMVIYASALSIRLGSAYQASFEVIRQIWILFVQFFECLNVATQALCATALGKEDRLAARSLLNRLLFLGTGVGALVGVAVWAAREPLIGFFTRDPVVVENVLTALPLLCAFFPIDAAASIMDGSLLAAKQSNYMSAVQIVGCAVQYGFLLYVAATGNVSTLAVWASLKILIVLRVAAGFVRNYLSPKSGYITALQGPPAGMAAAAEATVEPTEAEKQHATAAATATAADRAMQRAAAAAAPPPASVGAAVPVPESTLQSVEDDALVLAAAAAASATELNPDLLSLKQRRNDGGGGGNRGGAAGTAAISAALHGSGIGGGNRGGGGGGNGPNVAASTWTD
ncbi:hypothetical protein PLESTB_000657200 [Pleodorina starrii]|uniref:Protein DETOXIFICATION n=1 Tax=Pleodorina starrii TaxID=330485 RepID=A0A9W6BJR0_9CHLO|nr:hypothetical protein PLESTB_000657200 [Pleodorina starrii]